MKKTVFWTIVSLQVAVILFLGAKIFQNNISTFSIHPLKEDSIIFNKESRFDFFYEPLPKSEKDEAVLGSADKFVKYHNNSDGLRGEKEYKVAKPLGTFRIITLGDSFTYGLMVEDQYSYPQLLEDKLNELSCDESALFEVLNLGVPGYDIEYAVERFKMRGQKYNPDLIIWFIKEDDFIEADIIEKYFKENSDYNEAYKKALKTLTDIYGSEKNMAKKQKEYMISIRKYFEGKLLIITIPTNEEYNKILKEFVKITRNTYLFELFPEKGMQFADEHPNELGYEFISDNVLDYLKKSELIPCK